MVEIGRFGELLDIGAKMSPGFAEARVWRSGVATAAQRPGTAERNRAAALGFWVAAVVVWCAREGHGAKIKRKRPVIRACARSGRLWR